MAVLRTVVLGSRSPRRRLLLESVVPAGCLEILPPASADEPGFADCRTDRQIDERLRDIVALKFSDVAAQVKSQGCFSSAGPVDDRLPTGARATDAAFVPPVIIVADTTVVATTQSGHRIVLGQPEGPDWRKEVRHWLSDYLSGKSHSVRTCFQVVCGDVVVQHIVSSEVTFVALTPEMITWYIGTEEPLGKAGGYAIQGAGAAFVTRLDGSLTNVIGLPLKEVSEALAEFGSATRMHEVAH